MTDHVTLQARQKIDMAEFEHPLNTKVVDDYVYMLVKYFLAIISCVVLML
jgi:hypothetical protein